MPTAASRPVHAPQPAVATTAPTAANRMPPTHWPQLISVEDTLASSGRGAISATIVKKMAGTTPFDRPNTISHGVSIAPLTV